jgi:hypothetical protein
MEIPVPGETLVISGDAVRRFLSASELGAVLSR